MAARRRSKSKAKPTQFHPILTVKRKIVWVQKWNANRLTEARKLDMESRKAAKASREARAEKSAGRDAAHRSRVEAGAKQEQARRAPQVIRVPGESAAASARKRTGTTRAVVKPARPAPVRDRPGYPTAEGLQKAGLCGHDTKDGGRCTHPVREGRCAAGHTPARVLKVEGQPSRWAQTMKGSTSRA